MPASDCVLVLDLGEQQLYRRGCPLALRPKELQLLRLLVMQRGRVWHKSEILEQVWPGTAVGEACVKDHIKALRRALGDDVARPRYIETRRGLGYRFIGEITIREPASGASAPVSHELTPGELAPQAAPLEPALAVLPFAGADLPAYLCDGFCEDIISGLGRFRQLLVLSRHSSFQCRGLPPREAARRLGARWLVLGRFERRAGGLELDVQLLDGTSGAERWAQRHPAERLELPALQRELVAAVVMTLAGELERAQLRHALLTPAPERSAYEQVLEARHRLASMTEPDVLAARASLRQTLERSPQCASAYTWLAETYYWEAHSPWCNDPATAARQALELGQRAVALDGLDSLAHLCVAWGQLSVHESTELAQAQTARALALNPNDYYALCFQSSLLLCTGELDAAVLCVRQALLRSPLTPATCWFTLGFARYLQQDYPGALQAFGDISRPRPEVHAGVAACYAQLGRQEQALAAAREFRAARSGAPPAAAHPESRAGEKEAWRQHWRRCLPLHEPGCLARLLQGLERAGLP